MEFDNLTDYERGEYDAVHSFEAQPNQPREYYWGYGDAYAQEQVADATTIKQEELIYDLG